MTQPDGECEISTDAKRSRCPIICSGPGSSIIRGRNSANEEHTAIDPYLHRAHFAHGDHLSARNSISRRAARECSATQPSSRPTLIGRDACLTQVSPVTILAAYRRTTNATSRYWQYRLHAAVRQPGDVDDAGAGILLWRARRTKERARHHDAELRLDGLDHGVVVGLRILALFLRRSEERHGLFRHHRQPELGGPARHHALDAIAERHDPDARLLRLSDDVRHHHAGADHWRIYQPHHLQGLHAVSDGVADLWSTFRSSTWCGAAASWRSGA